MGIAIDYQDYCYDYFRLRYYCKEQFWILTFLQRPDDQFHDQFSALLSKHWHLSCCKNGLIDLRDISFVNHDEAFGDIVNFTITKLDAQRKYVVLCNTPLETALFYLVKRKAQEHNMTFNLFSTMDAALAYLNIHADALSIDIDLNDIKKMSKASIRPQY